LPNCGRDLAPVLELDGVVDDVIVLPEHVVADGHAGRIFVRLPSWSDRDLRQRGLRAWCAEESQQRDGDEDQGAAHGGDSSTYGHRDRITTLALAPRPTVCASPTDAPSTCRGPHSPRSWCTSSTTWPTAEAPNGSPLDSNPPLG